jgi:hypothetical protein
MAPSQATMFKPTHGARQFSNKNVGGNGNSNKKASNAADPKSEEAAMVGAKEFMD